MAVKRKIQQPVSVGSTPSLTDIARLASVSLPTASLAMSNHPRVADRTKLRVMDAAKSLGYVPNHVARKIIRARLTHRSETFDQVGFICFDEVRPKVDIPSVSILCGAEQEVSSYGAAVVFLRVGKDSGHEKIERLAKAGWVDGWLLEGRVDDKAVEMVASPGAPFVIVGGHKCTRPVHKVDVNYHEMGRLAATHLASLGHRRIGYLCGSMRHRYQWEVLNAFRATVREMELDNDDSLFPTPPDPAVMQPLQERLKLLLALPQRPTALFTAEPGFATIIIDLLHEQGLEIPRDFNLLGCEFEGGYCTVPGLARVENPLGEVGRAGAELLHEVARKGTIPARQVLISPTIVEGTSCRQADIKG